VQLCATDEVTFKHIPDGKPALRESNPRGGELERSLRIHSGQVRAVFGRGVDIVQGIDVD